MDQLSSSDAGTNLSLDALATLLGVKGHLRLVPQGPTPKPHVVIKRDYPKGDDDLEDLPPGVARFSFIAGKKFSVSKGQPLLFAVASPTDRDGKTLLSDESTFLIEADIADGSEENNEEEEEEEVYQRRRKRKRIENIEGLPPKMRKSYTKKTTYESFIEREAASSLGFQGYPLGGSTPRVYSSAAVQTENVQTTTPISLESISLPRDSTSIPGHVDKSPIQLPSPVSADHALEPISEDLAPLEGEETDAFSRAERSLSPMDLSSAAGSASCSPALKELPLREEKPTTLVCDTQPIERVATLPLDVPPQLPSTSSEAAEGSASPVEPVVPQPPPEAPPPEVQPLFTPPRTLSPPPPPSSPPQENDPSDSLKAKKLSKVSTPPRSPSPLPPAPPQETDSSESAKAKKPSETAEVVPKQPIPTQELSIKKELVMEVERALAVQNAPTSTPVAKPTPIMPRAMRATPYMSERAKGKASAIAPGQDYLPTPISMRISNTSAHARSVSPPPDPKQLAYISSGSSSNPLGIRPSHVLQRAAPTAPRSLLSSTSTTSAPKKPLVVGAKWSAARNSGSNSNAAPSSSTSNGSISLSASTSSSSLTSVSSTSSPVVPSASAPAALSSLIPYASPSPPPPPPPESDSPPPPLPPQPAVAAGGKWKRISSVDDQKVDVVSKAPTQSATPKETPSPTSPSVPNRSLKRPLDSLMEGNTEDKQGGGPSKKVKDSPPPATPSTTTSTATTMTSSTNPQPSTSSFTKPQLATSSTNAASSSSSSTSSKPQQPTASSSSSALKSTIPQPLKHPLPPKPPAPQPTGSSYRPSASTKSERTPEASSSSSEAKRAPQGRTDWPSTQPSSHYKLHAEGSSVGVQKIVFSTNGSLFAVVCTDRTLRICENKQPPTEVARLSHNAPLLSVCWMEGDGAVLVLTGEGILGSWTRNGKVWNFAKLQRITELAFTESDMVPQMVYLKDHIAVIVPSGVKVWLLRRGELRSQRDISRSGVTAIRLVQDGKALVGGCKDGVLWYCEMPNGTLRVHSFLSNMAITSIDVHPTAQYLLVSQAGGKAVLVTLKPNETASVERTYTNEKLQALTPNRFPAVFATKGQAVLYGTVNGCALVWDRKKGVIVYGLKHPEGDSIQAAATFDGGPGLEGMMITGTKHGRLFWWPQPVAAAPSHPTSSTNSSNGDERKRQKAGS